MVLVTDNPLEFLLDVPAEPFGIRHVDSAIHKTKTVGRANVRIGRNIEDRTLVNAHKLKVAAVSPPSYREIRFTGGEDDLHGETSVTLKGLGGWLRGGVDCGWAGTTALGGFETCVSAFPAD